MLQPIRHKNDKVVRDLRRNISSLNSDLERSSSVIDKKGKLYFHTIGLLTRSIKEKNFLKSLPPKEVEVEKRVEIPVEVIKEVVKDCDHLEEIEDLRNKLTLYKLSRKSERKRLETALLQSRLLREELNKTQSYQAILREKKSKIISTYIYLSTLILLVQSLFLLSF